MATMAKDKIYIAAQPNFGWNLEGRYNETMDDWRVLHNNPVRTPAKKFGIRCIPDRIICRSTRVSPVLCHRAPRHGWGRARLCRGGSVA